MRNVLKKILPKKIKRIIIYLLCAIKVYGKFFARLCLGRYATISKRRKYPTTLQLPITYKCNFDCVMCGMRKMISNSNITPDELRTILNDKLFRKIKSVGLNGGEPFLLKDLEQYVYAITESLPKMSDLFIITNGYPTNNIIEKLKIIYKHCNQKNIKLTVSISVDGVGEMQDIMRGKAGAFKHICETLSQIEDDKIHLCDYYQIACTITKVNVYHITELEAWAENMGYPVTFNIATVHKRLKNEDKYDQFSLFGDEHARMLAAEFFYSKYFETHSERYYGLYYYIKYKKRIMMCYHKNDAVTLLPNGHLAYCATHSDEVGNCCTDKAKNIFFNSDNIAYRKEMQATYCDECSQYSAILTPQAYLKHYAKERMKDVAI
jgi:MoaA/NifB/PqqE/SkfB family radical SAM enzyme